MTQEIWEKKIPAGKYSGPSIARLEITPARNGSAMRSYGIEGSKRIYDEKFVESEDAVAARRIALKADGFKVVNKAVKVRPENAPRGPSEGGEALRQYDAELAEMFRRNRPTRP